MDYIIFYWIRNHEHPRRMFTTATDEREAYDNLEKEMEETGMGRDSIDEATVYESQAGKCFCP